MEIIASITSALTIVSKLKKALIKIKEAEIKLLLSDLTNNLADVKLEASELKVEIIKLKEENQSLKDALERKNSIKPKLQWGCYKFEGEEGLYCPACYEKNGKKIPTSRVGTKYRKCPACNAELS